MAPWKSLKAMRFTVTVVGGLGPGLASAGPWTEAAPTKVSAVTVVSVIRRVRRLCMCGSSSRPPDQATLPLLADERESSLDRFSATVARLRPAVGAGHAARISA